MQIDIITLDNGSAGSRRAAGRDLRRQAARRHHGARGALAAGQAPRRHAQDQGHGRGVTARPRSRTARRAPATPARAACARRSSAPAASCTARWCAPRLRPAEEGAPPGPDLRAVAEAGRGQAGRAGRAPAPAARRRNWRSKLKALGWRSALIVDRAVDRGFPARQPQHPRRRRAADRRRERLRHPEPRRAGDHHRRRRRAEARLGWPATRCRAGGTEVAPIVAASEHGAAGEGEPA